MNCQLCQEKLDAYCEGKLPGNMMTQVESHLETCETCFSFYKLQVLAEKVIRQEKEYQTDQYLATKIMARIDNKPVTVYPRALRPVFIAVSMAAAIFFGIILGNFASHENRSEKIPVELALIDDTTIESVDILTND